ncbi:hypothetical protein [Aquabacterium sp.]|uniref:hypothetical protein n=1 Tax=Aquabacterium sp. TaxID=1872578 RepID=UPI0035B28888
MSNASNVSTFIYNDTEFGLRAAGVAWDVTRALPGGAEAVVATGVFAGLSAEAALERARSLVHTVCPVGVKTIGPDVAHPLRVGDLKIVGPDLTHANFVYWNQDSTSFAR